MRSISALPFRVSRLGLCFFSFVLLGVLLGYGQIIFGLFLLMASIVSMVFVNPLSAFKYFVKSFILTSSKTDHFPVELRSFASIVQRSVRKNTVMTPFYIFWSRYNNWSTLLASGKAPLRSGEEFLGINTCSNMKSMVRLKSSLESLISLLQSYPLDDVSTDAGLKLLHNANYPRLVDALTSVDTDITLFYRRNVDLFRYISSVLKHFHNHDLEMPRCAAARIGQDIDAVMQVVGALVVRCSPKRCSLGGQREFSAFESFHRLDKFSKNGSFVGEDSTEVTCKRHAHNYGESGVFKDA